MTIVERELTHEQRDNSLREKKTRAQQRTVDTHATFNAAIVDVLVVLMKFGQHLIGQRGQRSHEYAEAKAERYDVENVVQIVNARAAHHIQQISD